MRASTLFALTVAALLALGAAVGAKYLGLFNGEKPRAERPEPTIRILVARTNIYEGVAITTDQVQVRNLRADEVDSYKVWKDKLLPPSVVAAHLRIPKRNIEADKPILKDDLEDLAFPEGVPLRLTPGMRSVHLELPKDRCAGGLIARGDHVDVLLTSQICDGENCKVSTIETATLARGVRVIAKRNNLWTVLRPLPENQPVSYEIEANPYRVALIAYAKHRGLITLVPSRKEEAIKPIAGQGGRVTYAVLDSPEFADEDAKVGGILRGERTVGSADLERIFKLGPIKRPSPPPPPYFIQQISGVAPVGESIFDRQTGTRIPRPTPPPAGQEQQTVLGQSRFGYVFKIPETPGSSGSSRSPADCPTCPR